MFIGDLWWRDVNGNDINYVEIYTFKYFFLIKNKFFYIYYFVLGNNKSEPVETVNGEWYI